MRLAAVTMVYDEAMLLPIWLRHYAAAVGAAHCHVVDHGSTDGGADGLGAVNVLRLPRSPHDDERRAAFVADYCASLLRWYDAVVYTDVDELLVADPAFHPDLESCAAAMTNDAATACGINLLGDAGAPALDGARPLGGQIRHGWFSSALCKPVLIRRRVEWAPGFHCTTAAVRFAPLFLLHLRYADRGTALRRLAKTRAMAWAEPHAGAHQRVSDAAFGAMLDRLQAMDRRDDIELRMDAPPLSEWIARVAASQAGRETDRYRIALDIDCYELWRLPDRIAALY